jgi:hypothetical protein
MIKLLLYSKMAKFFFGLLESENVRNRVPGEHAFPDLPIALV